MRAFLSRLEKNTAFLFLTILSTVFFVFRIPSFFEPNWYGDEGVYETIGYALRHGRILYQSIWDNKPPLLYLIYALFSGDQMMVRISSAVASIGVLVCFYFLAKKLFYKEKIAMVCTILLAILLATPFFEGNIANAENFLVLPVVAGMTLILSRILAEKKYTEITPRVLFLSGILFSLGFLIKIVAIFDFAAAFVFLLFLEIPLKISLRQAIPILRNLVMKLYPFVVAFLMPIILCSIYFLMHGALGDFIYAAFRSNFGYVNYGNTFIIPQGLLIGKLLLLAGVLVFLFFKRKNISVEAQFIFIWFFFSLFNVFFSQRPYTHYTQLILPAGVLSIGLFLTDRKVRKILVVILLLSVLLIGKHFGFYGVPRSVKYYQNFLKFTSGRETTRAYRSFFDSRVPRDYDLTSYLHLHTKPGDTVFLWGNNPQIYALTKTLPPGRYTVTYHILQYKNAIAETKVSLMKNQPKFIVILPDAGNFPFSLYNYHYTFTIENTAIYEHTQETNGR